MIGEELGLSARELELLNWSGLVHDIGKLEVPVEILNKVGRPTDAEWEILKHHPAAADRLIEPLRPFLGLFAESATQHHERWDGSGYPRGLAGTDITLAGRIVAVADAYDVMTSVRSYKTGMAPEEARRELARCAGAQFDPTVVRAFLNINIGRLRLVLGPLSSLAQMPFFGASAGTVSVSSAGASVALTAIGAMAMAGGLPSAPSQELALADPAPVVSSATIALDETFVPNSTIAVRGQTPPETVTANALTRSTTTQPAPLATRTPAPSRPAPTTAPPSPTSTTAPSPTSAAPPSPTSTTGPPANNAPEAADTSITMDEDTIAFASVLSSASDGDDDVLTIVEATALRIGGAQQTRGGVANQERSPLLSVDVDGNRLRLTPARDATGRELVEYTISDGNGGTATGRLDVVVVPVNDAPVAIADQYSIAFGTATVLAVSTNDIDVDNDELTLRSVTNVVRGTASVSNGAVAFVPEPGYTGGASFRYTIADPSGASSSTTVTVTVGPAPLIAGDDAASTNEDVFVDLAVLGNDSGVVGSPTVQIVTPPSAGSAVWNGSVVRYQPDADTFGRDTFRYEVCLGDRRCARADVTMTVLSVNDRPSFQVDDLEIDEDAGLVEIDDWATAVSVGPVNESTQGHSYLITVSDPDLLATPPSMTATNDLTLETKADANGVMTLSVTMVDDGGTANNGGTRSLTRTARLTIRPVNDAPVAGDDAVLISDDDPDGSDADLLANDTDVDDAVLWIEAVPVRAPTSGAGRSRFRRDVRLHARHRIQRPRFLRVSGR